MRRVELTVQASATATVTDVRKFVTAGTRVSNVLVRTSLIRPVRREVMVTFPRTESIRTYGATHCNRYKVGPREISLCTISNDPTVRVARTQSEDDLLPEPYHGHAAAGRMRDRKHVGGWSTVVVVLDEEQRSANGGDYTELTKQSGGRVSACLVKRRNGRQLNTLPACTPSRPSSFFVTMFALRKAGSVARVSSTTCSSLDAS